MRTEKMNSIDKRILRRTLLILRKNVGHFTSRGVHLESGLEHIRNRTIRRHINKLGFYYLGSRKKRLLSVKDLKLRRTFSRKITHRGLGAGFWRHNISLHLEVPYLLSTSICYVFRTLVLVLYNCLVCL